MPNFVNTTAVTESTVDTTNLEAPVYEGYSIENNGDLQLITESNDDALAIMEAIYYIDMAEVAQTRAVQESTGTEEDFDAVTEATVKDAAQKIKEFFQKMWGKLVAFFKSVVAHLDAFTKSGAKFAEKYEKALAKKDLSGFKAKVHTYTNLEAQWGKDELSGHVKSLLDTAVAVASSADGGKNEELKSAIAKVKESREEIIGKYRGEMVGAGQLNDSEFKRELHSVFRNGAKQGEEKKETSIKISEILAGIKDTHAIKSAKEFKAGIDKEFKDVLTKIGNIEKSLKKSSTIKHGDTEHKVEKDGTGVALEALRTYSTFFSQYKGIQMTAFRAWRSAITERQASFRSVVVSAVSYKGESK